MSLSTESDVARSERLLLHRLVTPITVTLAYVAATSVMLWLLREHITQHHLIFIYLVPTALIAIRYGSISAMGVTIVSSVGAAYFIYAPLYSFVIADRLEALELVLFCMLALLASQVVSGFADDRDVERRRRSASARWLAVLRARLGLTP